jgi:serine/threonine-protein kinase
MHRSFAAGDVIAGYQVESFIARGGMAVVYCARDVRLNRRVALKLLAPELTEDDNFRQRFMRESRLAASIDHPQIIPIYRAGQFEDLLYLSMRYVEGTDLGKLITREGLLSAERAVVLFDQLAGALDTAHAHGLVHRDVKPGNVLVSRDPGRRDLHHYYLTDFGLTKRAASLSGLTKSGQFLGTVDYVAPEQITGQTVDARTDIYALGCVLYETLTGRPPFDRQPDAAVIYSHLSQPPPSVAASRQDLPREVDRIVATAMAKRPDDRYPTCHDLVTDLRSVVGEPTGPIRAALPGGSPAASVTTPASRSTQLRTKPPGALWDAKPLTTRPTQPRLTPVGRPTPANSAGPLRNGPTSADENRLPTPEDRPASREEGARWHLPLIKAVLVALALVLVVLMFSEVF